MSKTTETVLNGMEITCRIDEYLTYVLRDTNNKLLIENFCCFDGVKDLLICEKNRKIHFIYIP